MSKSFILMPKLFQHMGVFVLRMKVKIKSTIKALTDASQEIEKVFHTGVVDGFDTKPEGPLDSDISLEISRV